MQLFVFCFFFLSSYETGAGAVVKNKNLNNTVYFQIDHLFICCELKKNTASTKFNILYLGLVSNAGRRKNSK